MSENVAITQTFLALRATTASHTGRTGQVNADALAVREPQGPVERARKGSLWVVADGMGSGSQAVQASRLVAEVIADAYWDSPHPSPVERLRIAVERTNALLISQNEPIEDPLAQFAATMLAAVLIKNQLYIANAGRSRAYLLRYGVLKQLTNDHTWVAEQARAGKLPLAELTTHPNRNVITRCVGIDTSLDIEITEITVEPDDIILLCSDGLWRLVDDARLTTLLQRFGADAASVLVDEANRLGGTDNTTVVAIAISSLADREVRVLERITQINRLGLELMTSLDLDATLQNVVEQLLALTGGQRAAILLKDARGELQPMFTKEIQGRGVTSGHSRSVAEQALASRQPVYIPNALDDPRFSTTESIVGPALHSILCVPMIANRDAIGVLYVDSTDASGMIEQVDLDALLSFGSQAASAIQNARLHQELRTRTQELEAEHRRQDSIFRSLSSALIAVTNERIVTHWNPAAEEILGIQARAALNAPLLDVVGPGLGGWITSLIAQVEMGSNTIFMGDEWRGPVGKRPDVVLAGRVARIVDPDGVVNGFVFIVSDRTEMVLIEEARRAERTERERLRDLFSRYLAPPIAERILNSPDAIKLGGSRQDITVLYADVRGFTSLSERYAPEETVAVLNRFLSLATTTIFEHLGTLDKYLGDGVMALFGAPLPLPNHALAAVQAAVSMRAQLDRLREESGVQVSFGIGLNSGQAIVGNIGTNELMSYTAIGDVVNVAARLQAEARSGEILITEETLAQIKDHVDVEGLGPIFLKGRAVPVKTYKVRWFAGMENLAANQ